MGVKFTYNINKQEYDFDFDIYWWSEGEDRSVFSSNHFKIIEQYSSRVKLEQERAKKGTKEYKKKNKKKIPTHVWNTITF